MTIEDLFVFAQGFVQKWEGGLCDDAGDPGGITKYGVSLRYLKDLPKTIADIDGDGDVDADDIRALSKDDAARLFKRSFWDEPKTYLLEDPVAFVFYDTAVNCGVGRASRLLQRAVGAKEDGVVGPMTRAMCKNVSSFHAASAMIRCRETFYRSLVEQKPEMGKFLKGWLNRTADLRKYLERTWGGAYVAR